MSTDNGGPAFAQPMSTEHRIKDGQVISLMAGMTLRDYFAGQALAGMMANSAEVVYYKPPSDVANVCYQFADAMIAERAKA